MTAVGAMRRPEDDRPVCSFCGGRGYVASARTPYRIRCGGCGWEAVDIYSLEDAAKKFSSRLIRRGDE